MWFTEDNGSGKESDSDSKIILDRTAETQVPHLQHVSQPSYISIQYQCLKI